jgi:hypothetical protein
MRQEPKNLSSIMSDLHCIAKLTESVLKKITSRKQKLSLEDVTKVERIRKYAKSLSRKVSLSIDKVYIGIRHDATYEVYEGTPYQGNYVSIFGPFKSKEEAKRTIKQRFLPGNKYLPKE